MIPGRFSIGMKARTEVNTAKTTGTEIPCTPRTAAFKPLSPRCRSRSTFSATTIASSTTIPSTRMKAKSESMFTDVPVHAITMSAPRKDSGMPIDTQIEMRKRRKSASTAKTRARPWAPLRRSRFRRLRRISEASCHTSARIPSGSSGRSCSTYSCTALATCRALSSPTRKTWTITTGRPLKRASWSVSSKPSTTVATSRRWTRVPSGRVITTISSNSGPW